MESSEFWEPFCWTGVRISDFVEVGQVEYLSEFILAPDRPCSRSAKMSPQNPGKGQRKRSATPAPAATAKRLFEFDDESVVLPRRRWVYFDDPNFECASKTREKMRRPVKMVAAVVLRLSCSQIPVNFYISFHISAIVF